MRSFFGLYVALFHNLIGAFSCCIRVAFVLHFMKQIGSNRNESFQVEPNRFSENPLKMGMNDKNAVCTAFFSLVEARGVEPLSENAYAQLSTSVGYAFLFPRRPIIDKVTVW